MKFELEPYGLVSLAHYLVKEGLCKIRDDKDVQLLQAQQDAQQKRKNIWANYTDEELAHEDDKENEVENGLESGKESDVLDLKDLKKVVVSIVSDDALSVHVQKVEHGLALEELMNSLRNDLTTNPPLPGAYRPKQGDHCAAIFKEDGNLNSLQFYFL